MKIKHSSFLLLGGNEANTLVLFDQVRNHLDTSNKMGIVEVSSVYASPPWGFDANRDFYNQVMHITTSLSAQELLKHLLSLEEKLGRTRSEKLGYQSRSIDIDILYFNAEVIDTPILKIPHPRLHLRRFTMMPLAEIAPKHLHPQLKLDQETLLRKCTDKSNVTRIA